MAYRAERQAGSICWRGKVGRLALSIGLARSDIAPRRRFARYNVLSASLISFSMEKFRHPCPKPTDPVTLARMLPLVIGVAAMAATQLSAMDTDGNDTDKESPMHGRCNTPATLRPGIATSQYPCGFWLSMTEATLRRFPSSTVDRANRWRRVWISPTPDFSRDSV